MSEQNFRIKDIAKKAGVSTGTVDRVLHNRGKVSDEALAKVTAVLNEIDYKPNLIARTLGSKRTFTIAVILPNQEDDPYWNQSKKGVKQGAEEWSQYGITIKTFLFDKQSGSSFIKCTQEALNSEPDGILITPLFLHEARSFFKYWKENNVPYVLFNTNLTEAHPLSFIGQNLFESGKVAAELMLLGHTETIKLVVLHVEEDVHNSPHLIEKEKGFIEYCKSMPFEVNVISLNLGHVNKNSMERVLNSITDDKEVKGLLITTSKETAIVASLMKEYNRPDICLIGYDLLDENLMYLRAGTIKFLINQNPKRQAQLGISHLANYLLFQKTPSLQELFPLEIITKENLNSYMASGIH